MQKYYLHFVGKVELQDELILCMIAYPREIKLSFRTGSLATRSLPSAQLPGSCHHSGCPTLASSPTTSSCHQSDCPALASSATTRFSSVTRLPRSCKKPTNLLKTSALLTSQQLCCPTFSSLIAQLLIVMLPSS